MNEQGKKNISNAEWGLLIGVLIVTDLIQIGLDVFFQVGVFINRFIDIAVALALLLYCLLRPIKLNSKTFGSIVAVFLLEEIPDVDIAPLWSADGFYIMWDYKKSALMGEVGIPDKNAKLGKGQKNVAVLNQNLKRRPVPRIVESEEDSDEESTVPQKNEKANIDLNTRDINQKVGGDKNARDVVPNTSEADQKKPIQKLGPLVREQGGASSAPAQKASAPNAGK